MIHYLPTLERSAARLQLWVGLRASESFGLLQTLKKQKVGGSPRKVESSVAVQYLILINVNQIEFYVIRLIRTEFAHNI